APGTGRTLWTFDAGRNVELLTLESSPPQIGAHTLTLRDRRGQLSALNIADGSRRLIRSSAPAWCRKAILYRQKVPYQTNRGTNACRFGGARALLPVGFALLGLAFGRAHRLLELA